MTKQEYLQLKRESAKEEYEMKASLEKRNQVELQGGSLYLIARDSVSRKKLEKMYRQAFRK